MFNRNLRTLSAKLIGLGLGFNARSFAANANVIDMVGSTLRIRENSIGDQYPEPEHPHGETHEWLSDPAQDSQQHQRDRVRTQDRWLLDADAIRRGRTTAVDHVSPVLGSMPAFASSLSSTSISTATPTTSSTLISADALGVRTLGDLSLSPWFSARTGPEAPATGPKPGAKAKKPVADKLVRSMSCSACDEVSMRSATVKRPVGTPSRPPARLREVIRTQVGVLAGSSRFSTAAAVTAAR